MILRDLKENVDGLVRKALGDGVYGLTQEFRTWADWFLRASDKERGENLRRTEGVSARNSLNFIPFKGNNQKRHVQFIFWVGDIARWYSKIILANEKEAKNLATTLKMVIDGANEHFNTLILSLERKGNK